MEDYEKELKRQNESECPKMTEDGNQIFLFTFFLNSVTL